MSDRAYEKRESWRDPNFRRVSWIVHGKALSVEFWVNVGMTEPLENLSLHGEPCWVGAFEVHNRAGDGEPSRSSCSVLGGNCWHDGTTLYAREFFETWDQQDNSAFAECEKFLRGLER